MATLTEELNFADTQKVDRAVEINKRNDVNFYETLCLYCANNDVNLEDVSDEEFEAASDTIENFGRNDMSKDVFYFWIDAN